MSKDQLSMPFGQISPVGSTQGSELPSGYSYGSLLMLGKEMTECRDASGELRARRSASTQSSADWRAAPIKS